MNLRKQLLLVSLLTLILPWAGCQVLRDTESALRQGQQQFLSGTAQAIADSLSQFPDELLAGKDDLRFGQNQLYGHPLATAPLIDGYLDDWTAPEGSAMPLRGTDGTINYVVGINRPHVYLHVDVRDASVIFDRGQDAIFPRSYSDHVALISVGDTGERTVFRFRAEAPGAIIATRESGGEVFDDTRIAAYWQDTPGGYRLEARIPRSLLGNRLGIVITNTDSATTAGVRSTTFDGDLPGRFVTVSPVMQSVAAGYVQPGWRLIVTDLHGWRLGQAGSITGAPDGFEELPPSTGWLRLAYNLLLEPGADAALAEPDASGREQQSYVSEALNGHAATRWFRNPGTGRAVVSVAHPIFSGSVQTGAIILQQGTDAILSLTNQAMIRLITLTLIVTIGVALVLLGYASWLSARIRQLSSAAERALDEKHVRTSLPSALAGDEIGDLSRSFSSVLQQLGNYNDYLQTLASKLSHELRTPLTIVKSSLENLEHESLSKESAVYTARAKEGVERLRKILSAMSEASRTEELIENVDPEKFDLDKVLESTLAAYADAWPERGFSYLNRSTDANVFGSPELVIQMLDKLADNAVDFSTVGDEIQVALDSNPEYAEISIFNPGPSLPDNMRTQLFHSMVSVRHGDGKRHLGLGLYVARLIAEGHNGSISADNTDGGVTFTVSLPLAPAD
ncbi:putative Sensor histidine kinase [uncultured Woeseiaceae bacterium]|uniref:histidine kinase n=1 Tax=uncultured Woeseiaceae bacterium TaxID=1983305 RepID=A0A7D9D1B9_9GAMM|nr:putative Sensor histidine kinase [uncultured Woeseiaceae bacterium]